MKYLAMFARIKTFCSYIKSNWETWTAVAVTVLLSGFEMFSDYIPLVAGALGGWQLVVVTSVVSFAIAYLRAKQRKEIARKRRAKAKPKSKPAAEK
ncbi:hypothetical protein [Comamonas terrigena]|uniref:hypothetical protein n=1 Tax=Comamonas terrigena TaxID=32013 RepID=UPI0028975538|nr:hypothetical protein [Comamonas terrigena]